MRRIDCRPAVAWLLCSMLVLVGSGLAIAQGTTSRLVGLVRDTSGAVVPGATVTLTNESTGASFFSETTQAGAYVFEAVQVGVYTVTVELQGFKKFVSTGNRVIIAEPTTVNVTLEPGGLAETVEVRGRSEVVQVSTSGNIGTNFEQRVIESLPIVGGRGRNPIELVMTQPGVVGGANTGGGVHVHGARDRAWNYTLDGIDINETSAGGGNFSPLRTNPDALAEFQVITGNTTAEYGRNSGGQVAMITRSGTISTARSSISTGGPSTTPTSGRTTSTRCLNGTSRSTFQASAWAVRSSAIARSSLPTCSGCARSRRDR